MASTELHFLMVPQVAQGHIIPTVEVAILLARRGVCVTVVTTPVHAARNRAAVDGARRTGLAVEIAEIAFPGPRFGLPEGVENIDQMPMNTVDLAVGKAFLKATWAMADSLEEYIRALPHRLDCVIADGCSPWTAAVCDRLAIPRLVLHCIASYYLLAVHNIFVHGLYDRVASDLETFEVPDFPVRAVGNRATFRGFVDWPGLEKEWRDVLEARATADGHIFNTSRDIDGAFVDAYALAYGKRSWAVGPTCARRMDASALSSRGNRAHSDVDIGSIIAFLDAQPSASVLYISFGSLMCLSAKQIIELARGLEASGRLFVWAIKEAEKDAAVREWLNGDRFEERVKERGLLVRGWAPQVAILSHPAVGGFLTHCGWNATLEAITHGVPALTWPGYVDQFSCEQLLVDVLRVGVRSGVKLPPMHLPKEVEGVQLAGGDLEKAIRELMDDGPEGTARRARVKELAVKVRAAVEVDGASYSDLTDIIRFVSELSGKKRSHAAHEMDSPTTAAAMLTSNNGERENKL